MNNIRKGVLSKAPQYFTRCVKLNFRQHVDTTILKVNKGISVIQKFRYSLLQKLLVTIHKAFFKASNGSSLANPKMSLFVKKIESVQ